MEFLFVIMWGIVVYYIGKWGAIDSARKTGMIHFFGEKYRVTKIHKE